MAALPKGVSRKDLNRLLELDEQIKAAEREREALKDRVKRALRGVKGNRVYGEVILMLGEQHRFDPAAFAQDHDPITHPEYYEVQVAESRIPDAVRAEYVKPIQTLQVKRNGDRPDPVALVINASVPEYDMFGNRNPEWAAR